MPSDEAPTTTPTAIDEAAQPHWLRTGYKFFPYAAEHSGQWWVLRLNYGFPEHDMYTLFVDGRPAVDITGSSDHSGALARSIASLRPYDRGADAPTLEKDTATTVVRTVSHYVDYGSEHEDPCIFCSDEHDGMVRI